MGTPRKQRGHIEERSNGTFRAIVSAGAVPFTGKRIFLKETYDSYDEAEVGLTDLLYQVDKGKVDKGKLTVMDVLDKYRAVVDPKQKRRTKVRRDQLIRDYLQPRFGGTSRDA